MGVYVSILNGEVKTVLTEKVSFEQKQVGGIGPMDIQEENIPDGGKSDGRPFRKKYVECVRKHQEDQCGWDREKEGRWHIGQEGRKETRPAHASAKTCFATLYAPHPRKCCP